MSTVRTRKIPRGRPDLETLAGVGPKLFVASLESTREFFRQATEIVPPVTGVKALRPRGMCAIPESECPPRCVCEITWGAGPGETVACTLRVRNESGAKRDFRASATPLRGPGGSAGAPTVSPEGFSLPLGDAAAVRVAYTVPEGLAPGRYEGEVRIEGAYEQCVRLRLNVEGRAHCTCEVVHRRPPVRRRAHRWHDHFLCEEPCVPERAPRD